MVAGNDRGIAFTARCFDMAMSERGPTQLNIPRDFFYGEADYDIDDGFPLPLGVFDVSELVGLNYGHIDDKSAVARVMGKGRKELVDPLDDLTGGTFAKG